MSFFKNKRRFLPLAVAEAVDRYSSRIRAQIEDMVSEEDDLGAGEEDEGRRPVPPLPPLHQQNHYYVKCMPIELDDVGAVRSVAVFENHLLLGASEGLFVIHNYQARFGNQNVKPVAIIHDIPFGKLQVFEGKVLFALAGNPLSLRAYSIESIRSLLKLASGWKMHRSFEKLNTKYNHVTLSFEDRSLQRSAWAAEFQLATETSKGVLDFSPCNTRDDGVHVIVSMRRELLLLGWHPALGFTRRKEFWTPATPKHIKLFMLSHWDDQGIITSEKESILVGYRKEWNTIETSNGKVASILSNEILEFATFMEEGNTWQKYAGQPLLISTCNGTKHVVGNQVVQWGWREGWQVGKLQRVEAVAEARRVAAVGTCGVEIREYDNGAAVIHIRAQADFLSISSAIMWLQQDNWLYAVDCLANNSIICSPPPFH